MKYLLLQYSQRNTSWKILSKKEVKEWFDYTIDKKKFKFVSRLPEEYSRVIFKKSDIKHLGEFCILRLSDGYFLRRKDIKNL